MTELLSNFAWADCVPWVWKARKEAEAGLQAELAEARRAAEGLTGRALLMEASPGMSPQRRFSWGRHAMAGFLPSRVLRL